MNEVTGVNSAKVCIQPVDTNSRTSGNGLVATTTISVTEEVCSVTKPLLVALDTARLRDTCYQCYTQPPQSPPPHDDAGSGLQGHDDLLSSHLALKTLRLCSGCKTVRYCSPKCQKLSWSLHKLECKVFHKLHPVVLPNYMRAVIRYVLDTQRSPGTLSTKSTDKPRQWHDFKECPSHVEEIKTRRDDEFLKLVQMAQATIEYTMTSMTFSDVFEMYCRLRINSITLMTGLFDPLGLCLHPLLAKINHSCSPNAYIRFSNNLSPIPDRGIQVRPLRDIKEGEEITISYIEDNQVYEMRQEELHDRYFFSCRCTRCEEQNKAISDDPKTYAFSTTSRALQATIMKYAEGTTDIEGGRDNEIHNLQHALHLLSSNGWMPTTYPYPQIIQQLKTAHIDAGQFSHATAYAMVQHFYLDPQMSDLPFSSSSFSSSSLSLTSTTTTTTSTSTGNINKNPHQHNENGSAQENQTFHPLHLIHTYTLVRLLTALIDSPQSHSQKTVDLDPTDLQFWHTHLSTHLHHQSLAMDSTGEFQKYMDLQLGYHSGPFSVSSLRRQPPTPATEKEYQRRHAKVEKMIDLVLHRQNL